jgi:hypothetical protein
MMRSDTPDIDVVYKLTRVISDARRDVCILWPADVLTESLMTSVAPALLEVVRRHAVEAKLCIRRTPGVKSSVGSAAAVQLFHRIGSEIHTYVAPADQHGYVLADSQVAMLWPTDDGARMTFQLADINALVAHFTTAWSRSDVQTLYEDWVEPSRPELILPFQAAQRHWDYVIRQLAQSPLDLTTIDPHEFEELVAELLRREGYADVALTSRSHDGGRDLLVATNTALGQHLYFVECKRYQQENPVGVGLVRSLYGVVEAERATAALLVTTSYFTRDAVRFKEQVPHRLALTDYKQLVNWLRRLSE